MEFLLFELAKPALALAVSTVLAFVIARVTKIRNLYKGSLFRVPSANEWDGTIPSDREYVDGVKNRKFYSKTGIKYKYSRTEPEANQVNYNLPVDDNNINIPPYLAAYLLEDETNPDKYRKMVTSIILQLVKSKAVTVVYSTKSELGVQVNKLVDNSLTTAEAEVYSRLLTLSKEGQKTLILTRQLVDKILTEYRLAEWLENDLQNQGFFEKMMIPKKYIITGMALSLIGALFLPTSLLSTIITLAIILLNIGVGFVLYKKANQVTVVTLKGSAYIVRIKEFRKYFVSTQPAAKYGVEKADLKGELLPWGYVFNQLSQWSDVFAQPYEIEGVETKVIINGNVYSKELLHTALLKVNSVEEDVKEEKTSRRKFVFPRF